MVAARLLLDPDDVVWLEDPGYPPLRGPSGRSRCKAGSGRGRRRGAVGPRWAAGGAPAETHLHRPIAPVSVGRDDERGATAGASRLRATGRCLDLRGRLRQRMALRRPASGGGAEPRSRWARALCRHLLAGPVPVDPARVRRRAAVIWSGRSSLPSRRWTISLRCWCSRPWRRSSQRAIWRPISAASDGATRSSRNSLLAAAQRHLGGLLDLSADAGGMQLVGYLHDDLLARMDDREASRRAAAVGIAAPVLSVHWMGHAQRQGSDTWLHRAARATVRHRRQPACAGTFVKIIGGLGVAIANSMTQRIRRRQGRRDGGVQSAEVASDRRRNEGRLRPTSRPADRLDFLQTSVFGLALVGRPAHASEATTPSRGIRRRDARSDDADPRPQERR